MLRFLIVVSLILSAHAFVPVASAQDLRQYPTNLDYGAGVSQFGWRSEILEDEERINFYYVTLFGGAHIKLHKATEKVWFGAYPGVEALLDVLFNGEESSLSFIQIPLYLTATFNTYGSEYPQKGIRITAGVGGAIGWRTKDEADFYGAPGWMTEIGIGSDKTSWKLRYARNIGKAELSTGAAFDRAAIYLAHEIRL